MRLPLHHARPGIAGSPPDPNAITLIDPSVDGSFARTSEASQFGNFDFDDGADALGSGMVWRASNIRRTYPDGSILLEGSRTNLILDSEDFTKTAWTKNAGNTTLTGGEVAPDGQADAYRVQTAASQWGLFHGLAVVAINQNVCLSMFHRQGAITNHRHYAYTNLNNVAAKISSVPGADWGRVMSDGLWKQTASAFVHLMEGRANNPDTGDSALGAGDQDIWGVQVENNVAFPTSYIRTITSGASTTRAAETLSLSSWDPRVATERWRLSFWPLLSSSEMTAPIVLMRRGTGLEDLYLTGTTIVLRNGGSSIQRTITWDRYSRIDVVASPRRGELIVSGALTGNGYVTGPVGAWGTTGSLTIGAASGGVAPCYARYSKVWLA